MVFWVSTLLVTGRQKKNLKCPGSTLVTEGKAKGLPSGLIIFPGFSESLLKEVWAGFQVCPPGLHGSALLRQGTRGAA